MAANLTATRETCQRWDRKQMIVGALFVMPY